MENFDFVNEQLAANMEEEGNTTAEKDNIIPEVKQEEEQVENIENEAANVPEAPEESAQDSPSCKSHKCCCKCLHWVLTIVLILAVIALFILHFTRNNKAVVLPEGQDHTGIILTVNNDSILEYFELVALLKADLEAESDKYTKEMQGKYAAFQTKVQNYQINVQNQVLTQTQMQNAERDLAREQQDLQDLESRYTTILANKEASVQSEITDSIINATQRVNDRKYKADYVFATAKGSAIVCANPTFDITKEVIEELNSAYKKSH